MKKLILCCLVVGLITFSACSEEHSAEDSLVPNKSNAEEGFSSSSVETFHGEYGQLIDSRDGHVYKTVQIGSQTWMAENLYYDYNVNTAQSVCYDNDPSNCAVWGRYYTWSAAMDSAGVFSTNGVGCGYVETCNPVYPLQGVCPEGWHLPELSEYELLIETVGGKDIAGTMLKSTSGWEKYGEEYNGIDAYGFSGLPAGTGPHFYNSSFGAAMDFWTSTKGVESFGSAYYVGSLHSPIMTYRDGLTYDFSASVRCIKNVE